MHTEIRQLSVEDMQQLLRSRHPNQRPLSKTHLSKLSRAVKNRTFRPNGAPIVIDEDNHLVDGQHRLSAHVDNGVPMSRVVVVTGVPRDALDTIDTGQKARSAYDIAHIRGMEHRPDKHIVSAVTIEAHNFEHSASTLSQLEKLDIFQAYEDYDNLERLKKAAYGNLHGRLRNSWYAAAIIRIARTHPLAWDFGVAGLLNNPQFPSACVLHKKLNEVQSTRADAERDFKVAWFVFRAFVAHICGQHLDRLVSPLPSERKPANLSMEYFLRRFGDEPHAREIR